MTTNNKFMLSMATIAILSGASVALGAESELKVEQDKLQLGTQQVEIKGGTANVSPSDTDKTGPVTIKTTIGNTIGKDTMTQLNITAKEAAVNVGTANQSSGVVSIGGTAPTNGTAAADGYGVNIDAKSVALAGAANNETQLNVNQNSTITTTDGATLGANSAINIANGKNLTVNGGLTTSETSSKVSVNGGSLKLNGDLTATNGDISLGKDGALNVTGALTGTAGDIKLGGGTMSVGGVLTQTGTTIDLGGGTLNVNGGGSLAGDKLTLTNGGTLNFGAGANASADKPTATTISGAVSTTAGKATNINLSQNTKVTFGDSLTLTNNTDTALDKISLNGGTLEVKKLTADATNLNTLGGGVINFSDQTSTQTKDTGSTITNDFTISNGTALNLGKNAYLTLGGADKSVTTKGSKITFADSTSTLNVSNLNANASDFDMSKGGKIIFASGSKSQISGNVALGENQSYAFSAAGTLNLESLSLTKTGKIEFAGKDSVLNLANGMTSDDAKTQIVLKDGGTINFNGGNSVIKGSTTNVFTTATGKDTLFNVKGGALNLENVKLADGQAILTIDGGVVNAAGLTTTDAKNLALKQGTLNFVGKANDDGSKTQVESTIAALTLAENSTAVLNFNDKSSVKISDDNLDLGKTSATLNFNQGSLVTMNGTNATLTAHTLNLNGGQINLKKLVASKSERSDTLNLRFMGASASVKGDLANTTAFTLGTDDKGNHFIGKDSEEVKISANSSLALNLGTINANGKLTTETNGGKLIFGGSSLNVGAGGSLTIADTSKNLELKDGVGGLITLKGDGTKGGAMTITTGALDLSKTSLGIKIENGGKLTTTAASKISGSGNAIQLSDYTGIRVYGDITTATSGEFSYNKMGDLTLGKETTLGIYTSSNADGNLQEITAGKLTATDGANLAFGNGGVVKLMGEIQAGTSGSENKLNNAGFGSGLTLDENAVLEFASGSVNVKGVLGVETGKAATLKVSNAVANLNGGLSEITASKGFNKIELGGGTLNIKQDLTASSLDITHIQTNASSIGSTMNIDGTASITGSKFAILPLVETGATSYKVLSTTKGLTVSDLNTATSGTTGEFRTRNSLNGILSKYGLQVDDANKDKIKDGDKVITAKDSSVTVSLKNDGKNLFLERQVDMSSLAAVKVANLQADIDALGVMDKDKEIVGENSGQANTDVLKGVIDNLKARQTTAASQSNTELASELGGANSDFLLSAFGKKVGAINELTRNAVTLDIVKNGGQGIVADIKEGASSAANMSSSTSSVINTMNLSNDMAISGRIAQANNPYGNLAQGFAGYEYAAVSGDLPLYYANNGYKNGFWANAIGGLNKVEGEGGTLVGLSLGFDKQLENTLVGFYLSYAMAGLNDKIVEQGADNIQVGVYTSFNQRDIEVNVKAYGQVAVTETTAKRGEGEAEAKFTRLYGGVSANVGFIFALNNNKTFIKPYVGENYYYAHTPAYEESLQSDAALSVKSANNHALSFDVGVDLRQYFNENSFMYLTPSLERYVVNAGGDYTAGFIGSDTTFTIEGKSKTKTYGQVLVGGNIALSDKLNVNLGLGVKKILNGQIERANGDKVDEMYLSGNLGVKYRF